MKQLLIRFGLLVGALILRFRYSITYKGLSDVKKLLKDKSRGCLFLPNHPAVVVDPLIICLPLVRLFGVRPLIVEYMYYQPFFHGILRSINALAIPNFSTGFNPLKLKRAERMLSTISSGVKQGTRFLIYPAGTTKHQAKEVIGGAFGVHQLVAENPEVPIVLVRLTGLWGSSFSRALTAGETPDTKAALKKGFWTWVKNLFFFTPRRKVLVEFEIAGSNLPRKAPKQEFNRFLEYWYNKPFGEEGEPLSLVSYAFWKKDIPEIKAATAQKFDVSTVSQEIQNQIVAKLAELSKLPANQILPDLKLAEDLGLDSLDLAEIVSFLEEQYEASGVIPQDLHTVASLYVVATGTYAKKERAEAGWKMTGWTSARPHERLSLPEGNTIPELFLKACDKHLFDIACADPLRGPLTYFMCKKTVLVLRRQIAKLPGERIGILLPASTTAQLLVLACQMAGKTPVMINWTVGGKHLDTVVDVSGIQVVLSSWSFLDNLENVDISRIEPLLVVLEEMKVEIGLFALVKGTFSALRRSSALIKQLPATSPDHEAVVLFTSGTESMPKGVPLTHENILSDLRAALKTVKLYSDDKLLAMLPPFHSFGFTVTGILPLLCGMRVVYYPNPTDSKRLAKAIERWAASVLCSAPTFLKSVLYQVAHRTAESVRLIISGAEKAPEELYALVNKACPKALFVEGYGITECSPVISANASGERTNGVGQPLDGIKIQICDPENLQTQKGTDEIGLILTSGPNVFAGYLNKVVHEPFVVINGTTWYQTGDLGKLDQLGNLHLCGRLKRFIKIGGEMVSLTAIEEVLTSQNNGEQNQFAVMAEGDVLGKVQLVLFTPQSIEVSQVNQLLRKGGFSNLIKIDRVVQLDAIPQTATGKVAFRELEKMLKPK